jgi:hypothetical protein
MTTFDYTVAAELYAGGPRGSKGSKQLKYWRFPSAAEALRYAFETMPPTRLPGAVLDVGEQRFTHDEMERLYNDGAYPLSRAVPAP